jgi:hypothetical protein
LFDGPNATVTFKPVCAASAHRSFFNAGNSWGMVTQASDGRGRTDRFAVDYGSVTVKLLHLSGDAKVDAGSATVKLDATAVAATVSADAGGIHVALANPVTIAAGSTLTVSFTTR